MHLGKMIVLHPVMSSLPPWTTARISAFRGKQVCFHSIPIDLHTNSVFRLGFRSKILYPTFQFGSRLPDLWDGLARTWVLARGIAGNRLCL